MLSIPKEASRPLTAWLYAEWYVKSRYHYEGEVILPAHIFVALDAVFDVHEAPRLPLKSLEQSWVDTQRYLTAACALLGRDNPRRLSSADERHAGAGRARGASRTGVAAVLSDGRRRR